MLLCKRQRALVGASQRRLFPFVAATPGRPHGVDHVAGREIESRGDPGLAGRAAAQRPAGPGQLRSRRPVNRPADSAARLQMAVGGVDDDVHVQGRNVALEDLESVVRRHPGHSPALCVPAVENTLPAGSPAAPEPRRR